MQRKFTAASGIGAGLPGLLGWFLLQQMSGVILMSIGAIGLRIGIVAGSSAAGAAIGHLVGRNLGKAVGSTIHQTNQKEGSGFHDASTNWEAFISDMADEVDGFASQVENVPSIATII